MTGRWQIIYEQLKNYIEINPDIKISSNVVRIGNNVRSEFFRLFDSLIMEFIKENFPIELEKSNELSIKWTDVTKTITEDMHLKGIDIQSAVKYFLSGPVNGLIQGIYNPLFDLLKKRIDIYGFKQKAIDITSVDYRKYFLKGYQLWVIASMIKLMDGDKIYTVMATDERIDSTMLEVNPGAGICEEDVPEVKETNELIFENIDICSFLTPRIIIHSKLLDCFVALRPDFYKAHWKARFLNENQEWFSIKAIKKDFGESNLWPDLAIYISDNLVDLCLVADYHNIARPDIILDFKTTDSWTEGDGLTSIKRHYDILKPKLGAFAVSYIPVPQSVIKELEHSPQPQKSSFTESDKDKSAPEEIIANADYVSERTHSELPQTGEVSLDDTPERNIHLICTGFDIHFLQPIIDTLVDAFRPTNT